MDVRNCPSCGKIFNRLRRDICPACVQKEDQEYELVRDFIYDHPSVDVQGLHEGTGVAVDTIMKFLREDRLVNISKSLVLECESCGTGIASGRFCDSCKAGLTKDFSSVGKTKDVPQQPAKSSNGSFHFMRDRLNRNR